MKKNECWMFVAFAVTVATLPFCRVVAFGAEFPSEESRVAGLLSSTNFWLVSSADFDAVMSTNAVALGNLLSENEKRAVREWGRWVVSLSVPSYDSGKPKSLATWRRWALEKARALKFSADINQDSCNTDLWLAVADGLSLARSSIRDVPPMSMSDNGEYADRARFERNLSNEIARAVSGVNRRNADLLGDCAVRTIGKKYIPALPAEMRWSFYSNFVERARLTETERAEIRAAMTAKESESR